MPLQNIDVDK